MQTTCLSNIDTSSSVPIYQQIATDLRNRILLEEWLVGDQLPTEKDFIEHYGVACITLRQAMSLLEEDGLIVRKQGKGTFVNATSSRKLFTLNINYPLVIPKENKKMAPIDVVKTEIVLLQNSHRYICKQLNIEMNEPVVFLSRLFVVQSTAVGLNRAWFPAHLVPDLENLGLVDESISKTIKSRYNLEVTKIDNTIEASILNAVDAQLLSSSYGASVLKIDSTHYLENNNPVQYSQTLWISDYVKIRFENK